MACPALLVACAAAVWSPSVAVESRLQATCAADPVPDVRACLLTFMAEHGATPEALEFSRGLEDDGWLRRFTRRGRVGVAEVRRPFRPGAVDAVLLTDGKPPIVDVSSVAAARSWTDESLLAAVLRAHPRATPRADEPGEPEETVRPGGGQRFLFDLPVRECPACPELSSARVAFDFDGDGRSLGPKLLSTARPAVFEASGELRRGKSFEARIDADRVLRLVPFSEGWTVEVKDAKGNDYCSPVTPPFRGVNALTIFGSHFSGAASPDLGPVRAFRCVASPAEAAAAEKSLRRVLFPENTTWRETEAAAQDHERLAGTAQKGRLTITRLTLGPVAEGARPWIESLRFRFELRARDAAAR